MPTVTFSNTTHTVLPQRVYTRRLWSDPWTLVPYLHCIEAEWSVSPSIPTAALHWKFGDSILQPDAVAYAQFTRQLIGQGTGEKYFVKVEFDTDDPLSVRRWVGVLELTEEQIGGIEPWHGEQIISAYGIEKLLDDNPIQTSVWWDRTTVNALTTSAALTFNRGGVGNRFPTIRDGSYTFDPDLSQAEFWTSRDIVEYLLRYYLPQDAFGANPIAIYLDAASNTIPTWDEPEIEQDGQTLYSLLSRLMDRHRLLVWYLDYDDTANVLYLRVRTLASTQITVPHPLPACVAANSSQLDLVFDDDPLTTCAVKQSEIELVDQVIMYGAIRISVGTFNIAADSTLAIGWSTTKETAYEAGASGISGYANLATPDRQKRNAEQRDAPALEDVYSLFKIPVTWDRKVKDGAGGTANPLFPVDDGAGGFLPTSFPVFYPTMFVQQSLPLLVGVDYSGTNIEDGLYEEPLTNREEMAPLVLLKRPASSPARYVLAERIGDAAELERTDDDAPIFSCHVLVPQDSQAIRIRVTGAAQHAIADGWFTPLAVDVDPGGYAANTMVVTLALSDDRRVQGVWPPSFAAVTGKIVRRKLLFAGDKFRQDYVAPDTVVGIDSDGSLKRSDGGFIPTEGPGDDQHKLTALARIAYEWYGRTRYVMALETQRMPAVENIQLGMLVVDIGDLAGANAQTLNSVITRIMISSPMGAGREGDPSPQLRVDTWAGELDPIQLSPNAPESPQRDEYYGDSPGSIAPSSDRAELKKWYGDRGYDTDTHTMRKGK